MKRALVSLLVAISGVMAIAPPASAGTVYEVTHAWGVQNAKGQRMMTPSMRIRWSTGGNCRPGVNKCVTGIVDFDCWDGPGYTSYKGCETSHGAKGYQSMGWAVTWHYVLGFDPVGLVVKYYCTARGSVYADGRFTSGIVCDYGSGRVAHI